MTRFILSILAVGCGFMMVVVSALAVEKSQSPIVEVATASATASAEISTDQNIVAIQDLVGDYYLPYPGILPDHPLYRVKMLRDRIRLVLANTPEKKFELQLLYADKRIGAAEVLQNGGKVALAQETAFKAEGYLVQAANSAESINEAELWQRLRRASVKHLSILEAMMAIEGDVSRVERARDLNKTVTDKVNNYFGTDSLSQDMEVTENLLIEEISPAEFAN